MKKFLSLVLSMLIIASMATTAFAAELSNTVEKDDAVITAHIPNTHDIKIETDGNGKVYIDGSVVEIIKADRLSSPTVLICPESGYTIDKVMLGDEDITNKINGGFYTFDAVYKDNTLKLSFKKAENGSFNYSVVGTVTKNNSPAENVLLELRSELKTYTTGKDGKFGFKDVEEGHHTLTAIENGKIVGFTEFYLTQTDSVQNVEVKKNEDGSFNVQINKSFAILELNFNITDDGKLEITDGKATNKPEDVKDYPNAPQTGHNSNILLYFMMTVLSFGAIVVIVIISKRRKQTNN